MTDDISVPIPTKVADSFQRLQVAAAELNIVSNQLGVSISVLDTALQHLNLGISTWVHVDIWDNGHGDFELQEIGYTKVGSKWGIALRTTQGNFETDPEGNSHEQWLFNDAPRGLRIAAIDKLPDLLEKLAEDAKATAGRIRDKIEQSQQVARAITAPRSGQRK